MKPKIIHWAVIGGLMTAAAVVVTVRRAGLPCATAFVAGERGETTGNESFAIPPVASSVEATRSVLDRRVADAMREGIRRAWAHPATAGPAEEAPPAPFGVTDAAGRVSATGRLLAPMPAADSTHNDGGGPSLAQYISDRLQQDFVPLLQQCFADEVHKSPGLTGTAVLNYRIVGDESVGGVVDTATVDPMKSTLNSAEFSECVTESMKSVAFGAPPADQKELAGKYSITFGPNTPKSGG